MHSTSSSTSNDFSPCSIGAICSQLADNEDCLVTPGSLNKIKANICGNGVVEGDEQCDCGGAAACSVNPCCEAGCKLRGGMACDDATDGCCSDCQLKPLDTVCRESNDKCTFVQRCTGSSSQCPDSIKVDDGSSCELGGATGTTCASGICTSRELQCISSVAKGPFQTVGPCRGYDAQCDLVCRTLDGTCLNLNGNYIEGTPCAAGGRCASERCVGGDFWLGIKYYFDEIPEVAYTLTYVFAHPSDLTPFPF